MQSAWRVACVRIPRFPIGAVWQAARAGAPPEAGATASARLAQQLSLSLLPLPPHGGGAPDESPDGSFDAAARHPGDAHWDERPVAVVDGGVAPGAAALASPAPARRRRRG